MVTIELPVGLIDAPFENIQGYFEHFNCVAHPPKKKDAYFKVDAQDPINLFWAGGNLFIKGSSAITTSVSEKYFGK